MGQFAYTARDASGSPMAGVLSAGTIDEVRQMLRGEGKYATSIKPADGGAGSAEERSQARAGLRMSRKDLIQLTTQLGVMVESGVTVTDALESIATQAEKPNIRAILQDLSQQVQAGSDLSTALMRHPRAFPRLFIALMSASEKSGMMSKLLHRSTAYLRDEYEIVRKVRGAMTYPAIMLVFALSTTVFLLAFVLPRFTAIYASKRAALPAPTQMLMNLSDIVVHQWPWLLAGLAALGFGFWLFRRSQRGKRILDYLQLQVPIFGGIFRKLHLSRGLRMVGTMAGAGVSLVDCVKTAHSLCPNSYFRDLWDYVSQQIQAGKQLSEPLKESDLVPASISQMLFSAEKGGRLAQVMEQVATFSEDELKEKITDMTRYIEPAMIVVMGAIIGFVSIALMLPIFTISKVMAS